VAFGAGSGSASSITPFFVTLLLIAGGKLLIKTGTDVAVAIDQRMRGSSKLQPQEMDPQVNA